MRLPSARVGLFKSIGTVLELLPEKVDNQLATWIAGTLGRLSTTARDNLRVNVAHALATSPDAVDAALLERFVDRGFLTYGQYWAESAKLPAIPTPEMARRFVIDEGLEYLTSAYELGRGVVVALPHIGSWEWGGAFLSTIGMPMTAVAEELDPPTLFQWFRDKRESIGLHIEPLNENAGTVLLSLLRQGAVVGLLCDRDLQGNGIEVEFFGERVTMPAGPATLAIRTGATLLASACYTGPGAGHHAVMTPWIDTGRQGKMREDVQRVTQLVANQLEGLIRRAPEQWHVLQPRFKEVV